MDRVVKDIINKYAEQSIDFRDVSCTWKEAGLSIKSIKTSIYEDLHTEIDDVDAKKIYRFAMETANTEEYIAYLGGNDHEIEALMNKRLSKLTPNIKSRLINQGDSTYTIKEAQVHDISWRLVSKKGDDGKDVVYLARITNKVTGYEDDTMKVAAELPMQEQAPLGEGSEVLIAKVELKGDAVNLTPTNCPGKGKAQDIPVGEDGKQMCILSGKKCPHLKSFSLEPLAGDKTILCDIPKG